jgi:Neuraminidase (sialidase)
MPIPGSAEAAGAMCLTRSGDMVCCYAVYNTDDPNLKVTHNQVLCLVSKDQGKTWQHSAMLEFESKDDLGAESWVVELSDGRLLGIGWHIRGDIAQTNKYALSSDAGATWSRTLSTGVLGQYTALAPLAQGRALFIYNQRKQGDIGVWLALVQPTTGSLGLLVNERIWAAEVASRGDATADFKDWTSYAFGEPSVTPLADGTILVTLWALQPSGNGIRYIKLRIE